MSKRGWYCTCESAKRHVSLKTVVCDWQFQVTLIIHGLCPSNSGCQIPLAGLTSCHLLHQVSMTFLFKHSHLLWLLCITGLRWLKPFSCLLESLSCPISSPVCGSTHSTMWTHFCESHVRYSTTSKIRQAAFEKAKTKTMLSMPYN